MTTSNLEFRDGAFSPAAFAEKFLTPLFADDTIPEHSGTEFYAICYGELCAYAGEKLLAIWSREVPDNEEDYKHCKHFTNSHYAGEWKAYVYR